MRKDLVEGLNITESKVIEPSGYTSTELMYLAVEALGELGRRNKDVFEAIGNINLEISQVVHEIEFSPDEITNTEKVRLFLELQELNRARRKLKQEQVLNNRVVTGAKVEETKNQVASILSKLIRIEESYRKDKVNQQMPEFKQGELKRLIRKYANNRPHENPTT